MPLMPALPHPQKITFAEMRSTGVRGVLIYCSDHKCSHWTSLSADRWPDDVRLSDLEPLFVCQACGRRGADVRPNFDWEIEARAKQARQAEPAPQIFWLDCLNGFCSKCRAPIIPIPAFPVGPKCPARVETALPQARHRKKRCKR
jgi:hypothetical protein